MTNFISFVFNEESSRVVSKFSKADADICHCNENHCGDDGCLNRSLFTECIAGTCPVGDSCQNQRLQKREWAKTSIQHFGEKGWGVVCEASISPGQLVVEYIGEVCNLAEVELRSRRYENIDLQHTYIMNLNSNEVIDATHVGNFSRFINHSCEPNAECQKWTVRGEQRIGIFATRHISIGEEITYNYNLDWNGGRRVKCKCGAKNCVGYLGAESTLWKKTIQPQEDQEHEFETKKRKKEIERFSVALPEPEVREYQVEARLPLPMRYTLEQPPVLNGGQKRLHPLLISVIDIVPLSELLKDPFLKFNQEYYMALADITLASIPPYNNRNNQETSKTSN